MIDLLLISNGEPYQLGVYENSMLIESFSLDGKAANALPKLFLEVKNRYKNINRILLAVGPGNLTSIKLGYVAAKTASIAFNVCYYGVSSFEFNGKNPISAFGSKVFKIENGKIILDSGEPVKPSLPISIKDIEFIENLAPIYPLPSVN